MRSQTGLWIVLSVLLGGFLRADDDSPSERDPNLKPVIKQFKVVSVDLKTQAVAVTELPGAWRDGMRRLLGLEVPSDTLGCLQDIHWGGGSFGYFPSYALGCLIAAQLWEAIEASLGPRDEDLRRGEVRPIQAWLAENVHRHGRRLDTLPLLTQATGQGLSSEPFLRHVAPLAARPT